jgi:hypothetical protein
MRGLGSLFWRLFLSSSTSNLADGIGRIALPLLAATLTRDPLLISAVSALTFLPWLLFAICCSPWSAARSWTGLTDAEP